MWNSTLKAENDDLRHYARELERENQRLREELSWAEGEIDFLNNWEDTSKHTLRWYEKALRYVLS